MLRIPFLSGRRAPRRIATGFGLFSGRPLPETDVPRLRGRLRARGLASRGAPGRLLRLGAPRRGTGVRGRDRRGGDRGGPRERALRGRAALPPGERRELLLPARRQPRHLAARPRVQQPPDAPGRLDADARAVRPVAPPPRRRPRHPVHRHRRRRVGRRGRGRDPGRGRGLRGRAELRRADDRDVPAAPHRGRRPARRGRARAPAPERTTSPCSPRPGSRWPRPCSPRAATAPRPCSCARRCATARAPPRERFLLAECYARLGAYPPGPRGAGPRARRRSRPPRGTARAGGRAVPRQPVPGGARRGRGPARRPRVRARLRARGTCSATRSTRSATGGKAADAYLRAVELEPGMPLLLPQRRPGPRDGGRPATAPCSSTSRPRAGWPPRTRTTSSR